MTDVAPYTPEARELSKEEREAWVQSAYAHECQIKDGLTGARSSLWGAAEALYHFSEETGWAALGYETLGEWLASPEVTLSRRTYFQMVQAWRELVVLRSVDSANVRTLDLTKVSIALPAITKGTASTEEVLADVEALSAPDLREKYVRRGRSSEPPAETETDGVASDGETAPEAYAHEGDEPVEGEILDPLQEVGTVARGVAQTLAIVLEQVLLEVGLPQHNVLPDDLRQHLLHALGVAHAAGLGRDG
jgi:hypothetical protein